MTRHFSNVLNSIGWKDWLLAAALAITGSVAFSAALFGQDADADDELRAVREHGLTGVRSANCLIEVRGVEYLHDFCTFIPSDKKDGSFTIAANVDKRFLRVRVVLSAPASKDGVAYWNGPSGGRSLDELGQAHSEGACWRVGDAKGKDETRFCAWSTAAVDQPTPQEPRAGIVYYGERDGMYDAIVTSAGIDTDHARIVTKKSRDAAIIFCRSYNHDFTAECIEQTLRHTPTPILTADCPARTFADAFSTGPGPCDQCEPPQHLKFLGRNPDRNGQPRFLIQSLGSDGPVVLDGSSASTYDIAVDAYAALCPKTLEEAAPARQ